MATDGAPADGAAAAGAAAYGAPADGFVAADGAAADGADSGACRRDSAGPYFKVRRCKYVILEEACPFGNDCTYAHTPEELRVPSAAAEVDGGVRAPHWDGSTICVGVAEHAMFWDLPPVGTVDVLCNRSTCLGNPFATRRYAPNEARPPCDSEGWVPVEHEELCAAFAVYLRAALDHADDAGASLLSVVESMAEERSLTLADTWVLQRPCRRDVQGAVQGLVERAASGERLRLLCHCRPHVRCHAELLKAELERRVQLATATSVSSGTGAADRAGATAGRVDAFGCAWPGLGLQAPTCAGRRCWREGRALDPGSLRYFCSQCWSEYSNALKERASAGWNGTADTFEGSAGQAAALPSAPGSFGGSRPCTRFREASGCRFGARCWFAHCDAADGGGDAYEIRRAEQGVQVATAVSG
eukprot:TRINITY_DN24526_c0_g1_i2.p1 TRINITY_DN24526_c0_g1~~TRINITY_DN24526_c0_g1_i2.p1  ORF type:complete len:416 (-),score=74.07 TRINITY_DN24526_c0_g1_i2:144-1391(-)